MKFYVRGPSVKHQEWREIHLNPLTTWRESEYADQKYWLRTMGFVCFNPQTNFWFKLEK